MKVAVIGATGNAGSRIIAELLRRDHHVRAIVRPQINISSKNGVEVANSDLSLIPQLVGVLKGADAVVSAYRPPADDTDQIVATTKNITEAVTEKRAAVAGCWRSRRSVRGAGRHGYLKWPPFRNLLYRSLSLMSRSVRISRLAAISHRC
jgi:aspartate-semialdehyde dehydrogenase